MPFGDLHEVIEPLEFVVMEVVAEESLRDHMGDTELRRAFLGETLT